MSPADSTHTTAPLVSLVERARRRGASIDEVLPSFLLLVDAAPLFRPSVQDLYALALRTALGSTGAERGFAYLRLPGEETELVASRGDRESAPDARAVDALFGDAPELALTGFVVVRVPSEQGVCGALFLRTDRSLGDAEQGALDAMADVLATLTRERCAAGSLDHKDRLARAAAVVARPSHDVRGLLVPISVLAETFDPREGEWAEVQDRILTQVDEIIAALTGAARASGDHLSRAAFDVNDAVRSALARVPLLAHDVDVALHLDATQLVFGDRAAIELVMVHLLRNALDASEPGAGCVTVTTEEVGIRVRVSVQDRGRGIESADAARLLDALGSPGGQSLAVCHRIVRKHGGMLTLQRSAEGGTTATFDLPTA